jgi:hypothetical protein
MSNIVKAARECFECKKLKQKDLTVRTAKYLVFNESPNFGGDGTRKAQLRLCDTHAAGYGQEAKDAIPGTQWDGILWAPESGKAHLNPVKVKKAVEVAPAVVVEAGPADFEEIQALSAQTEAPVKTKRAKKVKDPNAPKVKRVRKPKAKSNLVQMKVA